MLRMTAAILLGLFLAGRGLAGTASPPGFISAEPDELIAAYGQEHADRVFSDELTPLRLEILQSSVEGIPGLTCPEGLPAALYAAYPYGTNKEAKAWIERYLLGCEPRVRRTIVFFFRDGEVHFVQLAPGGSIADMTLQADVQQMAGATVMARAPEDCNEGTVIDTAVVDGPNEAQAWSERWTFLTCGEVVELTVFFTHASDGGTDIRFTLPADN